MIAAGVAILVATRNRPERLAETLSRLAASGLGSLPLWVYDDASDDPESISRVVRNGWAKGELIRGGNKRGQAAGRNILLRVCGAEFAIMLDDDTYFLQTGALESHLASHSAHPRRAVVYFKCIAKADGRLDVPEFVQAREVPSFMGGCVLFHVPSVLSVGGYREFLVYGYEEPDLALQLWARGFHIWYDPSIVIEHNQYYTPEEKRDFKEYDYLYARNGILLATLNLPLYIGLPVGIARSIKRAFVHGRNYWPKACGFAAGLRDTVVHWRGRTPLSLRKTWMHQEFARDWDEVCRLARQQAAQRKSNETVAAETS